MNTKSQSKKVFSNTSKIMIDPLIKRHNSQESCTDGKTIEQEKTARTTKNLMNAASSGRIRFSSTTRKFLNQKTLDTAFCSSNKINSTNGNSNSNNSSRVLLKIQDDNLGKQIETEDNTNGYNFFEANFNINNFRSNNQTKNDDYFIEDDEEDEDDGDDENCDYDYNDTEEMRGSLVHTDFYTNSIAEASTSIVENGNGLINNLPKPFVKQSDKKMGKNEKVGVNINVGKKRVTSPNNNNEKCKSPIKKDEDKSKQRIDELYRKLISYAKKGDRDGFLSVLSKIYKNQKNKTNINYKDESGWSSLHYAADEGNLKIVEILIKMNVEVNCKTMNKKTPLHMAAEKGYFDISRILIENGAIISTLDDEKNNPIHISSLKGHYELLKYFLEKFPQADSKNIYGKTPLDLSKNEKIKELLKDYYNKNTFQYHKITIHDVDVKNSNKNNNSNNQNTKLDKKKSTNKFNNKLNVLKPSHTKFQSNDYGGNIGNSGNNTPINNPNTTKFNNNTSASNSNLIKKKKFSNKISSTVNSSPSSGSNSISAKSTTFASNNVNQKLSINKISNLNINTDIIENEDNNEEDEEDEDTVNPFSSIEEERIGPSSFICHALLGKGSFGEVYLVEKKNTKVLYAMKVLSKDKVMGQNLVKYAMTERNVLSITDHPFIVKLSCAFQSHETLFLILDYCSGGDLAQHLSKEKKFTEERAKIYMCEILLALEDLHKRDIIFRDLKPDNVVLDRQGHALLTDFGLSKEGVLDNKGAKSFCGSIAYLAPEMLKRTGHGKSVDWYLLGVLFYEMIVGVPPYFTNNKYFKFLFLEKIFSETSNMLI
jgi:hypothetical protein